MHSPARIIFMGSPEFALPVLMSLMERYQVVGVVTQPDRPAGRGRVVTRRRSKQPLWLMVFLLYSRKE